MTASTTPLVTRLTGEATQRVTDALTAIALGSGTDPVYATPAMVALMEAACVACLAPHLAPGESSLGVHIDVRHTAPTPPGLSVTAKATLTAVDGRKLTFAIEAQDDVEVIGTAVHTRIVVDSARFRAKAHSKSPNP